MKKLLFISTIILLASTISCQRYIAKHKSEICETCPEKIVERHDSIVTREIDTIFKISSVDSLIIAAGIFANMPAGITTDTIRIVDKVYDVSVWLENSRLKANIKHLNDTIDKIIVNNNSAVSNTEAKNTVVPKTVIKKTGRFYAWFTWISIVLLIIGILLKLYLHKFVKGLNEIFDKY